MPRIDIPPTKSNLRKIKNDLAFAHEGFDLLEQKREILVMEIMKNAGKARAVEENAAAALDELYAVFRDAVMAMGSETVARKGLSEKESYALSVEAYRFMGIDIPVMNLTETGMESCSSFYETTAQYDDSKQWCVRALAVLAEYSTLLKTIIVLSRELKKVQRKVNALEKIFIPQNEEAGKYISDRLEEIEREEIFVKKLIRQRRD